MVVENDQRMQCVLSDLDGRSKGQAAQQLSLECGPDPYCKVSSERRNATRDVPQRLCSYLSEAWIAEMRAAAPSERVTVVRKQLDHISPNASAASRRCVSILFTHSGADHGLCLAVCSCFPKLVLAIDST